MIRPPASFLGRFVWRIRVTLLKAIGPRPHPWYPPDLPKLGVSETALQDMRGLSTIAAGVELLRPEFRATIEEALDIVIARIQLPADARIERNDARR